jgi:outer membrane protein
MKFGNIRSVAGSVALLVASVSASGADLLSVYDQAVQNDPQIHQAEATLNANREARPQAWANLMPALQASAGKTKSWNTGTGFSEQPLLDPVTHVVIGKQVYPSGGDSNSTVSQWSLTLRQNIFSLPNYIAVMSANREVAQAEADFLSAQQQLVQRVAQQYFAVLQAQDSVRSQEIARDALSQQLDQAEQRFNVGLIAITDVQEARAAHDNAAANVIEAKRALSSAEEQLRATIGELPDSLNEPTNKMPLLTPDPASADEWVKASMEQNPALVSSRLAADIARDTVRSTAGSFAPSVDLVATKGYNDTTGDGTQPGDPTSYANQATRHSKSIALQFSLNLNGLGYGNYSRTRQSQYLWIAAKDRLDLTSRTTERQARDAYLSVTSEISRVQALQQALESSRTALDATQAGYEVGTRTAVDVLNQRQSLVAAEGAYSASKYAYLNNLIALHLAAGSLDRSTLEQINQWLGPPPATPATPAAPAQ